MERPERDCMEGCENKPVPEILILADCDQHNGGAGDACKGGVIGREIVQSMKGNMTKETCEGVRQSCAVYSRKSESFKRKPKWGIV